MNHFTWQVAAMYCQNVNLIGHIFLIDIANHSSKKFKKMKKFIPAIWLMLWQGSVFCVNAQPGVNITKFLTDNLLFTAMTDTSECISINESDSMAFGVATISVNSTWDTICFNATISGVTDSITAVGIYQGTLGNFGVEAFDLLPYTTNNERIVTTITAPFV